MASSPNIDVKVDVDTSKIQSAINDALRALTLIGIMGTVGAAVMEPPDITPETSDREYMLSRAAEIIRNVLDGEFGE